MLITESERGGLAGALRLEFDAITSSSVGVRVADQHLCVSATAWNSALLQTHLGAMVVSSNCCGFSSGSFVFLACSDNSRCRVACSFAGRYALRHAHRRRDHGLVRWDNNSLHAWCGHTGGFSGKKINLSP